MEKIKVIGQIKLKKIKRTDLHITDEVIMNKTTMYYHKRLNSESKENLN